MASTGAVWWWSRVLWWLGSLGNCFATQFSSLRHHKHMCMHTDMLTSPPLCVYLSLCFPSSLPALSAHSPRTAMAWRSLPLRSCACTITGTLALSAALPASTTSMGHTARGRAAARRHQQPSAERCVRAQGCQSLFGWGWVAAAVMLGRENRRCARCFWCVACWTSGRVVGLFLHSCRTHLPFPLFFRCSPSHKTGADQQV